MDFALNLLTDLGVNQTFFYHVGLSMVLLPLLYFFVTLPFYQAFEERQNQSSGRQKDADILAAQAQELEAAYQEQARNLNDKIKALFATEETKARAESMKMLEATQRQVAKDIAANHQKLKDQEQKARARLPEEIMDVSRAITAKLLGRELQG